MEVTDIGGFLTSDQKKDIEGTTSPVNMKVIFVSKGTKQELQSAAKACVTTPSTMCMAIDPIHQRTATEFGIDVGIQKDNHTQVARAGNPDFLKGDWVAGVKAVSARAGVMSLKTSGPAAVILQQPVINHPVPVWPFALGFSAIIIGVWLVWQRNRRRLDKTISEFNDEAQEYRSNNIREKAWAEKIKERVGDSPATSKPAPSTPKRETYVATEPKYVGEMPVTRPEFHVERRIVVEQPLPPSRPVISQPAPVVINQPAPVIIDRGPSFTDGLIIGEMLSERPVYVEEPVIHHRHRVVREDTPAPVLVSSPAPSLSVSSSPFSSNNDDDGDTSDMTDDDDDSGDSSDFTDS